MNTLLNRFFAQMLKPIVTLFLLPALFTLIGKFAFAQNVGIGASSFTPDAQAMLEVRSTTSGLLIPRMTAAERAAISAGAGSDYGLLVYQTDGIAGYYYWDGAAWQIVTSATTAWSLTGNASTNPASNYVGTSDAVELVLGTDGAARLRVGSGGEVAIGAAVNTAYQLYVTTSTDGDRAISAENTSTGTGTQYGIFGSKSGATGTGVGYGVAGSATGTGSSNFGVRAAASGATINLGVFALASGASGNNFGADVSNTSTLAASTQYGLRATKTGNLGAGTGTGYGVNGSATGTGSINYGLKGDAADASTNYGIHGTVSGATGNGYGGYFTNTHTTNASSQWGLYVTKSGNLTTGLGYGVQAVVSGTGTNSFAFAGTVSGATTTNKGIAATASGALGNNFGGDFTNSSNLAASTQYGLRATKSGALGAGTGTGYGVSGSASGTGLTNYGVYGTAADATNAYGVYGFANNGTTNNYGVYGSTNSTTNGVGVYGEANSVGTNIGVKGVSSSGFGSNYGMRAEGSGPSFSGNYGIEAAANGAPTNFGISASVTGATGTGYAGYFTNSQTTAASTQYAVYGIINATGTTNYALYGNASGATNNYGLFVNAGETKITDAGAALPARTANGSIATSTNGGNRLYFRTNATDYYIAASGTGDYSEYFRNSDPTLTIGEIVCIDPNNHNGVQKADYNSDGDVRMVGIVSKYGTRNNDDNNGQRYADNAFVNIGLLGQLQVRVSDENGTIKPGDALTLSTANPGIAVKATEEGRIIGYAMTHYPYVAGEITYPTHTGTKGEADILDVPHVMAFIQPGYYKPKQQVVKQ